MPVRYPDEELIAERRRLTQDPWTAVGRKCCCWHHPMERSVMRTPQTGDICQIQIISSVRHKKRVQLEGVDGTVEC